MKKRHTPEQIVLKLREAEAFLAGGLTVPAMCKKPDSRGFHVNFFL